MLITISRWPVLQKVRHRTLKALCLLVNIRFQVLFHSPPGVLFTVPSRYLFAIGHQGVFSLGRWSSRLHTRFLVSRATLSNLIFSIFNYEAFTLCRLSSQIIRLILNILYVNLGFVPFARRYLGYRFFFLFLGLIRCFSSPGFPSLYYFIHIKIHLMWVSPFGYLRVVACLQLTVAFRSLPRPSSALGAKAFTLCSCLFDLFFLLEF